jgi:hypothetical protein
VYSGVVATNHYLPFRAQWSWPLGYRYW